MKTAIMQKKTRGGENILEIEHSGAITCTYRGKTVPLYRAMLYMPGSISGMNLHTRTVKGQLLSEARSIPDHALSHVPHCGTTAVVDRIYGMEKHARGIRNERFAIRYAKKMKKCNTTRQVITTHNRIMRALQKKYRVKTGRNAPDPRILDYTANDARAILYMMSDTILYAPWRERGEEHREIIQKIMRDMRLSRQVRKKIREMTRDSDAPEKLYTGQAAFKKRYHAAIKNSRTIPAMIREHHAQTRKITPYANKIKYTHARKTIRDAVERLKYGNAKSGVRRAPDIAEKITVDSSPDFPRRSLMPDAGNTQKRPEKKDAYETAGKAQKKIRGCKMSAPKKTAVSKKIPKHACGRGGMTVTKSGAVTCMRALHAEERQKNPKNGDTHATPYITPSAKKRITQDGPVHGPEGSRAGYGTGAHRQ